MFTGSLASISNRATWTEAVELTSADNGQPIDLTGCRIVVAVTPQDSTAKLLSASTDDGSVQIDGDGVFSWSFTAAQVNGLCPGTYRVGSTIEKDGETVQLIIGTVPVLDGVVS